MKRKLKTGVLIGALIIPLLYSLFYLGAFWDPYSKLDQVPVAVVNLDEGASIDDSKRNLGDEICDDLKKDSSLDFVFTDFKDAKAGLEGDLYYAVITIPKDFSKNVFSTDMNDKKVPELNYAVNEKKNFLAAQILNMAIGNLEDRISSGINRDIVVKMADRLRDVPDSMDKISEGFTKLEDGTSVLVSGSYRLLEATSKLEDGAKKLENGAARLKGGTSKLLNGGSELSVGISKIQNGVANIQSRTAALDQLPAAIHSLAQGANNLNGGLNQFKTEMNAGLVTYKKGVDSYVQGYQVTYQLAQTSPAWATLSAEQKAKLQALNSNTSSMGVGYNQLVYNMNLGFDKSIVGSGQISGGLNQVYKKTEKLPELNQGLSQLKQGIDKASIGSSKLETGLRLLDKKAVELKMGASALKEGSEGVHGGVIKLNDGLLIFESALLDGHVALDDKIAEGRKDTLKLKGIEDFAEKPLDVKKDELNYVPNYGTAFAPYFLSLSLWVGGLIIFFGIYLDIDKRFKYLCRDSENVIIRSFSYLGLGIAQALVLALVIKYALGLEVDNFALYLLSCCLVSIVFISIIQFCLVHLKDMGKFIAIFLLILQLTSCGGTFPMETVPSFFNLMYPYMPMTYSVDLFKEVITGSTGGNMSEDIFILTLMMIAFMGGTLVVSLIKNRRRNNLESVTV